MRPPALPIAVPPARHETITSYLARLAALHGLDGDELWRQISTPAPTPSRRRVDIHQLAALTGRPPGHLAGALLELRDPPPTWRAFRHTAQRGCPRCDARHPGGAVYRIFQHHRYVCTRHRYWIGPPDIDHPSPSLQQHPDIVAAQRRHLHLVRRHGWSATYDAVLTAFMICGFHWDREHHATGDNDPPVAILRRTVWNLRALDLIPEGTEQRTFSASRLFAAVYPAAVSLAALLAAPSWRALAAGDDEELARFTRAIGHLTGDPGYRPRDVLDPIAHWIEQDCWRPPTTPPRTFPDTAGHSRPSHIATTYARSQERHQRAALWFTRKRRHGSVILHHRTIHPVVIREWSTPMQMYKGALLRAQSTEQRFRRTS